MRRKTLIRAALALAALAGVLTALYLMLCHEPGFYRSKEIQEGPLRKKQAGEFEISMFNLGAAIKEDRESWQETLTEAQINSYFQERFEQSGVASTMPVKGVHSVRVAIDGDLIRLGFRLGEPPWSTVISVDFQIWKVQIPQENNVVALKLMGVRAGVIPLSSKLLMDQMTGLIRSTNNDIEVSWYRHEGHLVALLRFGGSGRRSTSQLDQLRVHQGKIIIAGHSLNAPVHRGPAAAPKQD